MPFYITDPDQTSSNPVARAIGVVIALLALAGAFFFGMVILAVISALGLLFYLAIRLRMWWIMRHMPAANPVDEPSSSRRDAIDAEYTIISTKRD